MPNAYFSPAYRAGAWDGRVKLIRNRRIQIGAFLQFKGEAEAAGLRFKIEDTRVVPKFSKKAAKSDRAYQVDCMNALIEHSNCGGTVLCATGVGKTFIAGLYFSKLDGAGCFVVDELTLLKQAQADLKKVLKEEVGEIGDQKFNPKRITVATVQTMHLHRKDPRFAKWMKSLEVMFIDEVHQQINKRNIETVASIQPKAVFGLTATLQLKQRQILAKVSALTGPIIYRYQLKQGVAEKYLTPGVAVAVDIVRPKHRDAFDYPTLYDTHVVCSRRRNDLLEGLVREGVSRGKFIIILVDRVKHVKKLYTRLSDLSVQKVFGEVDVWDRVAAKKKFEKGKLQVLIVNKVFKKGVSINRVDVIIDAASMSSANDSVQKYGRGVRLCNEKQGLIYFDIGERTPDGEKHSLTRAAGKRRRALRNEGVAVEKIVGVEDPVKIYNFAETKLRKVLKAITSVK
jgi:superfamily II DNA or RNA helicase